MKIDTTIIRCADGCYQDYWVLVAPDGIVVGTPEREFKFRRWADVGKLVGFLMEAAPTVYQVESGREPDDGQIERRVVVTI